MNQKELLVHYAKKKEVLRKERRAIIFALIVEQPNAVNANSMMTLMDEQLLLTKMVHDLRVITKKVTDMGQEDGLQLVLLMVKMLSGMLNMLLESSRKTQVWLMKSLQITINYSKITWTLILDLNIKKS